MRIPRNPNPGHRNGFGWRLLPRRPVAPVAGAAIARDGKTPHEAPPPWPPRRTAKAASSRSSAKAAPVVRPEEKKAPSLADMLAAGSKKLKTVEKPDEGRRTSAAPNEPMLQMQKILDMRKFLQDPESSDEEDAEFD